MELAIKEIRKKLHLSQSELADTVGVSMRTVGSWERGESFPNAEQVWNCALALGCSPNEILSWDESDRSHEPLSDDEQEIVDNYRESTPQWRQNIAMTARAAAGESKETAERDVSATEEQAAV
ncbi:helix-turn-helix transcriptional regulator [Collinsella aerofaciens]|uniref:helix-turn-helix transcriptional regulator n=1 Tax=Collinsella aerofaciens TaxID=74426 RepID=UPI0034A2BE2D